MFQQLQSFLSTIPFFSSAVFGILALAIVGGSWCLVGLVMGDAPKRGIPPNLVQLFGSFISLCLSLTIMISSKGYPTSSLRVLLLTGGTIALGSFMNFYMLQTMSYAMQRGPNGIIWAIIQSSTVFQFIGGVLFFGVQATPMRCLGILFLLAALFFFGLSKDNSPKSIAVHPSSTSAHSIWERFMRHYRENWLIPTCLAATIVAIQQNISSAPAYFQEARGVNSIARTISGALGTFSAAVLYTFWNWTPAKKDAVLHGLKQSILWKYLLIMQGFNLFFAYTLHHPGMNAMADHGLGGMCYPVMVGSCIITFTLASVFLLKESITRKQLLALSLCIIGLVFLCTTADSKSRAGKSREYNLQTAAEQLSTQQEK